MASSASISGLSSGLDTATIVSQLMQIEAQPQTNLKTRLSSEKSLVSTLQALNTKTSVLASNAATLAKPATWQAVSATSSNAAVAVTATGTASATRLSVTVTGVAKTHQLGFADAAKLTDTVTGASTKVTINRFDGSPVELETGDGTLKGLVAAINSSANNTGLRATAVKSGDGYRLLVESTATGADQDFELTALDGSALLGGATVRAGSDASLDLGTGITVTSKTNTFSDLTPGVTLTLGADAAVGNVATISVSKDASKLSSSVSSMIDAMNSVLSEITTQTAYNATTKVSGPLAGDAGVRALSSSILSTVFPTTGKSLATVGIQTDRTGQITFDASKFAAAYAADPAGVEAMFTSTENGFANRVATVTKAASNTTNGTLTTAITGRNSGITRIQKDIDAWDVRLAAKQDSLNRQFTALETALNSMQSQSSWLSGQLSSLSSSS
jgi:flagellar hook-associated protein 2